MPRPREFDSNQVLDSAMQVFWSRGYDGTTVRDLVDATGLQPGSLYGAFDSKRKLFQLSLRRYEQRIDGHVVRLLQPGVAPLDSIREFFDFLLGEFGNDESKRGCLMINTLLQVPSADEEVSRQVIRMSAKLETAFRSLLLEAQALGHLSKGNSPDVLASSLLSVIFGLRVFNKTNPRPETLREVADAFLDCLI